METKTIEPTNPGQHKLKFKVGGLHKSTDTPEGTKISADKVTAALAGKYGSLAKKQAMFAKNVLHH